MVSNQVMLHRRLSAYTTLGEASAVGFAVGPKQPDATISFYPDISSPESKDFIDMIPVLLQLPNDQLAIRIEIYPTAASRLSWIRAASTDARGLLGSTPIDSGYIAELALHLGVESGIQAVIEFYTELFEEEIGEGGTLQDVVGIAAEHGSSSISELWEILQSAKYLDESLENGRRWAFEVLSVRNESQRERNSVVTVNGMVVDEVSMDAIASAAEAVPTLEEISSAEDSLPDS